MNKPDQYKLGKTVWEHHYNAKGKRVFIWQDNLLYESELIQMGATPVEPEQDEEFEEIEKMDTVRIPTVDSGLTIGYSTSQIGIKTNELVEAINELTRIVNQLQKEREK